MIRKYGGGEAWIATMSGLQEESREGKKEAQAVSKTPECWAIGLFFPDAGDGRSLARV